MAELELSIFVPRYCILNFRVLSSLLHYSHQCPSIFSQRKPEIKRASEYRREEVYYISHLLFEDDTNQISES